MERPQRLLVKHILRKIFLEDWAMKLIALAITFALWLGVTGLSKPGSERYTVPLTLRIPDNSIITNTPVQEVEVKISGDDRRLQQIKRGDLNATVDLSDVTAGDRVVSLTPETVSLDLPPGIKLEEVQPNKIAIKLEAVAEKEVAVKAEPVGEPAAGFEIYSETIVPATIRVRGPASFIRTLSSISTEPIDIRDQTSDFTAKQVPVVINNPKATPFETVVDVAFRIGEKRIERQITATADHRRVRLVLFGPRSLIESIDPAAVNIAIVRGDNGDETVNAILPPEMSGSIVVRSTKILN